MDSFFQNSIKKTDGNLSLQIQLFPKGSISLAELLQTLEDIPARDTAKAPANILQQ